MQGGFLCPVLEGSSVPRGFPVWDALGLGGSLAPSTERPQCTEGPWCKMALALGVSDMEHPHHCMGHAWHGQTEGNGGI